MNHTETIFRLLGVRPQEYFNIETAEGLILPYRYTLSEGLYLYREGNHTDWVPDGLTLLLKGHWKIRKVCSDDYDHFEHYGTFISR